MKQTTTLNEQIEQLLVEEQEREEQNSYKGKLKRILQADNRKQALKNELLTVMRSLSKKAIFTLFVIIAFIFMLVF